MTDEIPEIIDHSRVDAYAATRRRAMVLHSVWRPMLAGAAGAALVVAAVYVTLPKFSVREVVADHVVLRDVPFENHIPQDKPFDNYVPRNAPVAANPPPPPPPDVETLKPATPAEHKFISRPEFETAQYKGRLIADPGGLIRFDNGSVFVPVKPDTVTGHMIQDPDAMYAVSPYLGSLAFCNEIPADHEIPASDRRFKCEAIDHDVIVDLSTTYKPKGRKRSSLPSSTGKHGGVGVGVGASPTRLSNRQPSTALEFGE